MPELAIHVSGLSFYALVNMHKRRIEGNLAVWLCFLGRQGCAKDRTSWRFFLEPLECRFVGKCADSMCTVRNNQSKINEKVVSVIFEALRS